MHKVEGFSAKTLGTSLFNCQNNLMRSAVMVWLASSEKRKEPAAMAESAE